MTAYESTTTRIGAAEHGPCALVQDLLPLYLEGEVSSASRDTIAEHLARCERCAAFLAGAQSVRAQLRRDRSERERSAWQDAPARAMLGAGQRMVLVLVMLGLCVIGAIGSLMLWGGINYGGPGMSLAGMLISLACFGGLAALARRQAPMTRARWLKLAAFSLIGAIVPIMVQGAEGAAPVPLGILLAVVALAGVWSTIMPELQPRAEQQH